jgi:hypothetical protein
MAGMTEELSDLLPSAVRQIDTETLRALADEAVDAKFNARWYPGQLTGVDAHGRHLIYAIVQHKRRIEDPPHLRCLLLATMNDGTRACATIDVRNESFRALHAATDPTVTETWLLNYPGPTLLEWLDAHRTT